MTSELMMAAGVAILLAGAVLQLVLAVAGQLAQRRTRAGQYAMQMLQADLSAVRSEAAGLAERLGRMERTLAQIPDPTQRPVHHEIYDHSYAEAARLVRAGADAAEIVSSCGLVRGEAELLMRLYGAGAAPEGSSKASGIEKAGVRRPVQRDRKAGCEAGC